MTVHEIVRSQGLHVLFVITGRKEYATRPLSRCCWRPACSRHWRNFWNVQNSGNALVTTCHAP